MTTQDDEARRVRSYLLAQGEKYAFTELWPRLIRARLEVIAAVDGVSQEQADFTFAPEEWSIAEVLHHVLTSSARVAETIEAIANGNQPPERVIDPPRESAELGIEELRQQLTKDAHSPGASSRRGCPPSPTSRSPRPIRSSDNFTRAACTCSSESTT